MERRFSYNSLAVTAILLTFGLTGCGKKEAPAPAPVVRPVKTVLVGTGGLGKRTFPGRVEASQRVDLSFRVRGQLMELNAERGRSVKKNDLIARVDPRDYEIAQQEAQASYTKADADFKRYQSLYEKNAVSLAELDQYRSQRDVTKARLDDAKKNVEYTRMRAPFDGTISERFVENFQEVNVQQTIVSLENFSQLDIIIDVPEYILAGSKDIAEKVEVVARFDAAPGKRYPLVLKAVSAQADPATRTYQVRFSMPQPDDIDLLTGMTATVEGEGTRGEAAGARLTVPGTSVFEDDNGDAAVWVITEDLIATRRKVRVGELVGDGALEILEGLNEGDRVAVAAVSQLSEGMKVRLLEE